VTIQALTVPPLILKIPQIVLYYSPKKQFNFMVTKKKKIKIVSLRLAQKIPVDTNLSM
jgi:hypothetical protein